MTATRQERKSGRRSRRLRRRILLGVLAMAAAAAFAGGVSSAGVVTTELIAANRHTGLAIDGFDPVAYFTDATPAVGRPDLEVRHANAIWRFRNEGNHAAFAANPEPYVPQFGGHDPIAIARGSATPGHPESWVIVANRLYLFYDDVSLTAFLENPETAITAAVRRWPDVKSRLAP